MWSDCRFHLFPFPINIFTSMQSSRPIHLLIYQHCPPIIGIILILCSIHFFPP
uniref:Uncharacterized protein n=1 Tax=Rhizophora mucronata TaxID=61149 RepID=A0A2P2NKU6_RHIMU